MFTKEFFQETIIDPLIENLSSYKDLLIQLLIAIIIVIIGWIIAKIIQISTKLILRILNFDRFSDKSGLTKFLDSGGLHNIPSTTIANLLYWIIIFISVTVSVNIFTTQSAFQLVDRLILYIPQAIVAVFILMLGIAFGIFFGKLLRTAIIRSGIRENIALYFQLFLTISISFFAFILSLSILKVSERVIAVIINNLLEYIFIALAIAFGLGGRYIAADIIASFKLKQIYKKGDEVKYDNIKGVLKEITPFDSLVYTKDGIINIPNSRLAQKSIKRKI